MTTKDERRKQHRHRHKQRVLRGIDDQLATDFDAATHRAGSDRSNITRQLWEWYVRRDGAELPERPMREGGQ
jgi:metal-responsive CopG/Arc/MetJ family transcriptional regulator